MWMFGLKTLLADRGKLATALVGVVFSVVLINVQGGLFLGLLRKASLLVEHGEADVWVGHRRMHNVDFPQDIPRRYLHRIRAVPGVRAAEPYTLGHSVMTLPSGGFEAVLVIGCDPSHMLGGAWNLAEGDAADLLRTDGVFVDRSESEKLDHPRVGDLREIGGRRVRIAGLSDGILGFLVTPYVFTTLDRAHEMLRKPSDVCSYVLVRLAPGADAAAVCADIRRCAPELDAYPRDEYAAMSIDFWMTRTGLGISFGSSTLLGLIVGLIVVAQTLYSSVLGRLSEFGTLKALGAEERHIHHILWTQAAVLAGAGSILGLVVVHFIQALFDSPRAPIVVPSWLALGSCLVVLVICLIASWLPYLRVRRVDPVMVLQA